MTDGRDPIPPGTPDMLVLRTLVAAESELHGFEFAEAIEQRSREVLQVEEGSLYPALQRMLVSGWLQGEWGRRQLARRIDSYKRVSAAIGCILQAT
jgi:PadR family transcriptional regulator, regulatory protein PadR